MRTQYRSASLVTAWTFACVGAASRGSRNTPSNLASVGRWRREEATCFTHRFDHARARVLTRSMMAMSAGPRGSGAVPAAPPSPTPSDDGDVAKATPATSPPSCVTTAVC